MRSSGTSKTARRRRTSPGSSRERVRRPRPEAEGDASDDTTLLTLEVVDFKDEKHWVWRLKDSDGRVFGTHAVNLERETTEPEGAVKPPEATGPEEVTDPEYDAFLHLDTYLRVNAAPDSANDDERRLLAEVGAWIGRRVLGPIGRLIIDGADAPANGHRPVNRMSGGDQVDSSLRQKARTPTVVRVIVPPEPASASALLHRPLELAHVDGRPLALQEVSFVFELGEMGLRALTRRHTGPLRMLAVFSLPSDTSPLALRQERFQLQQLVGQLAQTRQIELQVLQFGATYEELRHKLTEGRGWDIVHFAGHGLAAKLVLETNDGGKRLVNSNEIVSLLSGNRKRLQWVTLSTCLSGANEISETRTWLGLEPEREDLEIERLEREASLDAERQLPGLARAIISKLDCAVLAMRYPVGDAFAASLGARVYRGVIEDAQSLPRALQLALPTVMASTDARSLSVATPALFGGRAARLALNPPSGSFRDVPLADLPPPPAHFVGRTSEMTRASAALAHESSHSAVLFHGMAGAGKTSCALELAYHFRDLTRFKGIVWFAAPEVGQDITTSLRTFAQKWDIFVRALAPKGQVQASLVASIERDDLTFSASLQRLKNDLYAAPVLILLDNIESLLRDDGSWKIPRWERLIAAMITAVGGSRLVLTSRIRPNFVTDPVAADRSVRVLEMPIHALSLNEGLLLARQLPNLGALMRRETAADENTRPDHLALVMNTLRVTQGHPKLIALAESQAADPLRLKSIVDQALEAFYVGENQLAAFFSEGASSLDATQFFAALGAWTHQVAGTLNRDAHIAFECLCWLEEKDRREKVFGAIWSDVWHHTVRNELPPDNEHAVNELRRAALIEVRTDGSYYIHPGIAETTCGHLSKKFRKAVDNAAASYWKAIFDHGLHEDDRGRGQDVVDAGLSAAPYFLRLGRWGDVAELLEEVRYRDESSATIAATVPLLRRVVGETAAHKRAARYMRILGGALLDAGQVKEAEAHLRNAAEQSEKQNNHREASVALDELIDLLRRTGRSQEALDLWGRMNGHTMAAGLGPWTVFVDKVWRLLLLHDIGRDEQVLQLAEQYYDEIGQLPKKCDRREATTPWTAKEMLFETGRVAAFGLGRWEQALEWNARSVESQRERKAPDLEVKRVQINDCEALVKLRQSTKAYKLALDCRRIFERESSAVDIATAFSALATIEHSRGNSRRAIAHERTALRHRYSEQSPDPEACAECHYRLASYLADDDALTAAAANWLTSALIRVRTISVENNHIRRTLDALQDDLARLRKSDPPVPTSFADLATFIGEAEGVPLAALFYGLPAAQEMEGDAVVSHILERVAYSAARSPQSETISEPDKNSASGPLDEYSAGLNPNDPGPQGPAMQWQASGDEERRITVVGQQPLPVGAVRAADNCTFLVYYATDRTRVPKEGRPIYGGRMDANLHFGHVRVSVPYHREMATITRPRWWGRQSPSKHIVLLGGSELLRNEFLGTLSDAMREAGQPVALIFIHGFNVDFDAAVRRTAQIAYDLHFEGAPILYSWPSAGKISSYWNDGENARMSATRLHEFLRLVLTEVGARTVHVIAHSMGNRVLIEALRDLDLSTLPVDAATLSEVVFAAPDVRSDIFRALAPRIRTYARRFTLYASSSDKALQAATKLQAGYSRAGYAGSDILLAEGIDTIDVSNVETDFLEHSFFGSNKSIIADLFQLLRNGQTPLERGLQSREHDGLPYWVVPA